MSKFVFQKEEEIKNLNYSLNDFKHSDVEMNELSNKLESLTKNIERAK